MTVSMNVSMTVSTIVPGFMTEIHLRGARR